MTMPDQVNLGQGCAFTIDHAIYRRENKKYPGQKTIMGFRIPSWQRPLVWTRGQEIKFIESAWLGIPMGTYTYNQPRAYDDRKFEGLLIDGQQRMMALQNYLDDAFSVFGLFWSETTEVDKRSFGNRSWHAYVTNSKDEAYLREYYNLMNFGGTVHKESERA